MLGVTLSRWTMSYFAVALVALLAGEVLMTAGYGFPSAPLRAPETLVVVHVVAIGWLSLLLCGALFQFVPVLIARPLHSNTLPLPALVLLLAGLGALLAGFLQLAGTLDPAPPLLPVAATLLAGGFALALYDLARTLWPARPLPLPARFVTVALFFLATTVTLGTLFSFALTTGLGSQPLLAIAGAGLPLHVVAGLAGWLTLAAIGVSYRLLAMFMLAPELEGTRSRAVFWTGTAGLALAVLGGLAALAFDAALAPALVGGGILGLVALVLYGADIVHLYRARKRRIIELNSQMAVFAFAALAVAAALAVTLIVLGRLSEQVGALVFLIAFGWLTGLGLAKLYKIVAFLTWLECYGPALGRAATPRVQDLVVEARARTWFLLYYLAVASATVALLAAHVLAFRLSAGAMTLATLAIAAELIRARRLADVSAAIRLPAGTRRPHLFMSTAHPNR
ncbi:MAG: hypothetical protein RIB97_17160 [Nitratireductor sp.]